MFFKKLLEIDSPAPKTHLLVELIEQEKMKKTSFFVVVVTSSNPGSLTS